MNRALWSSKPCHWIHFCAITGIFCSVLYFGLPTLNIRRNLLGSCPNPFRWDIEGDFVRVDGWQSTHLILCALSQFVLLLTNSIQQLGTGFVLLILRDKFASNGEFQDQLAHLGHRVRLAGQQVEM